MSQTYTAVGNLVAPIEVRTTGTGKPVGNGRIALSKRVRNKDTGDWEDKLQGYLDFTIWGDMAVHAAQSTAKGTRVFINGELEQDQFTDKAGNERTAWKLIVDSFGPDLRFHVTSVPAKAGSDGASQPTVPQTAAAAPAAAGAPAGQNPDLPF
jgi:single-strand DNA-binding protein